MNHALGFILIGLLFFLYVYMMQKTIDLKPGLLARGWGMVCQVLLIINVLGLVATVIAILIVIRGH